MRIVVSEVCGDSRLSREDGERLRHRIEALWSERGTIEVDFEDITIASAMFLDEAIAVLALRHSVDMIRERLRPLRLTDQDRKLLNRLVALRQGQRASLTKWEELSGG